MPLGSKFEVGDILVSKGNAKNSSFDRCEVVEVYVNGPRRVRYKLYGVDRKTGIPRRTDREEWVVINYYKKENTTVQDFNQGQESTYKPKSYSVDIPTSPTTPRRTRSDLKFLALGTTTLIHVTASGYVSQAKGKEAKVTLLLSAKGGTMIAVYPGLHSSDAFFIDYRTSALEALGMKKVEGFRRQVAADGSEWIAA
jgi:hypothetical protein